MGITKKFEIGIHHYYESNKIRLYLGWITFVIPFFYSYEGYEKSIHINKRGFDIVNNAHTHCYYWNKIFNNSKS